MDIFVYKKAGGVSFPDSTHNPKKMFSDTTMTSIHSFFFQHSTPPLSREVYVPINPWNVSRTYIGSPYFERIYNDPNDSTHKLTKDLNDLKKRLVAEKKGKKRATKGIKKKKSTPPPSPVYNKNFEEVSPPQTPETQSVMRETIVISDSEEEYHCSTQY